MRKDPNRKRRGAEKFASAPRLLATHTLTKPHWIRVRAHANGAVAEVRTTLATHRLVTVCQEASCPNLNECFNQGTATFMIMGDKCTRRCRFCDVAHGKPDPLDPTEPARLAAAIADLRLRYVVITSVDRDDLKDGGAAHFTACITAIRTAHPEIQIEILVPDFRDCPTIALDILTEALPDVFNHNIETVPRLYREARPAARYEGSLTLLSAFKERFPTIPTKSGLMLGLGETDAEVRETLADLRAHHCDRLTLGQYLQPSPHHLPVARYVHPETFAEFQHTAYGMGFSHVVSGPLVRSSYHAADAALETPR